MFSTQLTLQQSSWVYNHDDWCLVCATNATTLWCIFGGADESDPQVERGHSIGTSRVKDLTKKDVLVANNVDEFRCQRASVCAAGARAEQNWSPGPRREEKAEFFRGDLLKLQQIVWGLWNESVLCSCGTFCLWYASFLLVVIGLCCLFFCTLIGLCLQNFRKDFLRKNNQQTYRQGRVIHGRVCIF